MGVRHTSASSDSYHSLIKTWTTELLASARIELRSYAEIAGKPAGWSEGIIEKWIETITLQSHEAGGDELEYLIQQFLRALEKDQSNSAERTARDPNMYTEGPSKRVSYKGQTGSLTITTCDQLMDWFHAQDRYSKVMPKNVVGLGRRLRNMRSRTLMVLDERNAPELPQLKRKKNQRFIGLFEPES